MIDIENNSDSFDGNDPYRQATIAGTHLLIILFFILMISVLFGTSFFASTILATPLVVIYLINGFISPGQDQARGTDNVLAQTIFDDGGTKYIIYQRLGFKYPWERPAGIEVNIENASPLGARDLIVTVGNIAVEMRIVALWRVYIPRLSKFIQTAKTKESLDVTLRQMKALMCQAIEEYCAQAFVDNGTTLGIDQVRRDQTKILEYAMAVVNAKYRKEGFNLIQINFEKCDYSAKTQEKLDEMIVNRAAEVTALRLTNGDPEKVQQNLDAMKLVLAGTDVKLVRTENAHKIELDPATAAALAKLPPELLVAASLLHQQKNNKQK